MAKRKKKKKTLIVLIIVLLLLIALAGGAFIYINKQNNKTSPYYLASDKITVTLFGKEDDITLPRGTKVDIKNKRINIDEVEYCQFVYNEKTYYVLEKDLEVDRRNCVKEETLYALRSHVLTDAYDSFYISGWLNKKDEVKVSGYNELLDDGSVDYYYVNDTGYIKSKYLSDEYYETALDASIYGDTYIGQGGDPRLIEYYHKEETNFVSNKMPEVVKALYINAEAICDAQSYIDLANECGINAFVVDIKDCFVNTQLAYNSPVGEKYAPSTYNIPNTFDTYKTNVKKLKDAGYYLIGRITAFKDDSFAIDNPDEALMYAGRLYNYGGVKWPSVYSRKMWQYNLELGMEAVNEFGFNEIQYDYCRFPEDMDDVTCTNPYGETRSQAVTNFLRYASEYLHDHEVYVSCDVFGETSGDDYQTFSAWATYYGQFWPAMSNAADAISSMPYPDHFGGYSFGIPAPWFEPGELMYRWGLATHLCQDKTYDPAKCRTWIEAQSPDLYDIYYNYQEIYDQIDGLKKANVYDGFMTWNSASSLESYRRYKDAF